MAKTKMRELFTPAPTPVRSVPAEPRVIRVRYLQEWGGRGHWYMDGLRWPPVPAWMRHLDGRTWRGVALMVALATAAVGVALWWLLRLMGRAQ